MHLRALSCLGILAAAPALWAADGGAVRVHAEIGRERPLTIGLNDSVVPQFVDGDSWQTTLILTNLVNSTSYFRVFFLSDQGAPQLFNIAGLGTASSISGELAPGQTAEFATVGSAATLTQGYATVLNFDRPPSQEGAVLVPDMRTGGYAIFRRRLSGLPDQEAVVPISDLFEQHFTIPFDNRNGFLSGVAIVNATAQNGTVTVNARDLAGRLLKTESFPLASLAKQVYLVRDRYPETANQAGVLEYSISTIGLSGLGLRFNPTGSFTSTHPLRY